MLFLGYQVRKLAITFAPGTWQLGDSDICKIGVIQPPYLKIPQVLGEPGIIPSSSRKSDQGNKLLDLPEAEEKRVRQAAQILHQRLIFRQWLGRHGLHHAFSKLNSLDVSCLEDVYWLEDTVASHVLIPAELAIWSAARQSLPMEDDKLIRLKADLWSSVVKNCRHPDAWTYGDMVIVSASVAGLITLAAMMTQPDLTPEAKHSLLQYVTGKYLHAPSCEIEWDRSDSYSAGETVGFIVRCFQKNGHSYPVCDKDVFQVKIALGDQKVTSNVVLGSDDPAQANIMRVTFFVRTTGVYTVAVLIDGVSVCATRNVRVCGAACVCVRRVCAGVRLATPNAHTHIHATPTDAYGNITHHLDIKDFSIKLSPDDGCVESLFSFDAVNDRVLLALTPSKARVYKALMQFKGQTIVDGEFDFIVLSQSEYATCQRVITSKKPHAQFITHSLERDGDSARGRRMILDITQDVITVKDYWMNVIPRSVAVFKVKPHTKFILKENQSVSPGGEFSIDDGLQSPLELHSTERDVIAAIYSQIIDDRTYQDYSFKSKQERLHRSILSHFHICEEISRKTVRVIVSRDNLLLDSVRWLKTLPLKHWTRNFLVTFKGEQGVDWGGVRREWFSLLSCDLFSKGDLFSSLTNEHRLSPNYTRLKPNAHKIRLRNLELAGRVFGKCLFEGAFGGSYRQMVKARFARSFLAQIIGLPVHYKHFEYDDPELYCSKIRYLLETNLDSVENTPELYFVDDVYEENGQLVETHELIPNGSKIKVCESNKQSYIRELARWRLWLRCREQTDAFLRGVACLVPLKFLQSFSEEELELLSCGNEVISVSEWRENTIIVYPVGNSSKCEWSKTLDWFWTIVMDLSNEDRAKILHFATGSTRLPATGFQDLSPRFQILASASFGGLPTAHTCFNQLCLPTYGSYDEMQRAILWAIHEGGEGFAMA